MVKSHLYIQWNTITAHKAESPSICDNVAGTWGHYAKGNKSDRERKTMYDQKYKLSVINEQILGV